MPAASAPDRSGPDQVGLSHWLPGYCALAVIWGSSFLFIKVGVRELHPLYVTLGRVATGTLAVLVILLVTRTRLPREPRVWAHLTVAGVVGVVLPFTLFGYGEQRIPSMLAGIWNATTPLFVLPIAALVFRTERMTIRRIAGILLGFVGVLVVLGVWQGSRGATLTGQLMCLGAALCYGVSIPYQRRFLSGPAHSGVAVAGGQLLTAGAILSVVAPLVAGPAPTRLSADVVSSVVALGALGTGLAFVLNLRVIRFAGANTSASVTYLLPVVATVIGVLVLDETLSWHQPLGAAVVLIGVAISQGLPRRPRSPRTPTGSPRPARRSGSRNRPGTPGRAARRQPAARRSAAGQPSAPSQLPARVEADSGCRG